MPVSYLTSSTLINQVKLEGFIPETQNTLTSSDFLSFANQELKIGLVPSILQYHEEYYVRDSEPIELEAYRNSYPIPYRAVGGKFRDLYYLDSSNNLVAMTRIQPEQRAHYQQSNFSNRFLYFFLQGNEVVLVPDIGASPTGSLIFSYYLRPNDLVDESRVATITDIDTTDLDGEITSISVANPTVITSASHGLSTGNIITISDSDSTPSIDGSYEVTVLTSNTFTIDVNVTVGGTTGTWEYITTTYTVDDIPTQFSTSTPLDLLQTKSGHKTYAFDQTPLSVSTALNQIVFNTSQTRTPAISPNVGQSPVVGDYIALAGECIIPQVPSDLHDVLSQRVVIRCLHAIGDQSGLQNAAAKLAEMEKFAPTLIDNRSEGQTQKVNNLKGILRTSKIRRYRW